MDVVIKTNFWDRGIVLTSTVGSLRKRYLHQPFEIS
jgi:hypothetical protein